MWKGLGGKGCWESEVEWRDKSVSALRLQERWAGTAGCPETVESAKTPVLLTTSRLKERVRCLISVGCFVRDVERSAAADVDDIDTCAADDNLAAADEVAAAPDNSAGNDGDEVGGTCWDDDSENKNAHKSQRT